MAEKKLSTLLTRGIGRRVTYTSLGDHGDLYEGKIVEVGVDYVNIEDVSGMQVIIPFHTLRGIHFLLDK